MMHHRFIVANDRIEGPVFRTGTVWAQTILLELSGLVIEFVGIVGLMGWRDLAAWERCLGIGLVLLGLFCHLYPFLDQKWFVMDDRGVAYHGFRKDLFMPWEAVRCVALQTTARRFNRKHFICFSTEETCPPISKSYLEMFSNRWFGVHYRPELVAFAVRRAKNAVLTDEREGSPRERDSGKW